MDLPFTAAIEGRGLKIEGEVTIQRLDYGAGTGEQTSTAVVGNAVKIIFDLDAAAPWSEDTKNEG